ncbi:hypothetical protein SAMN02910447_03408 [Ruminococcus sp. YE71]|uniref:hypothetical protein n=1 Tax=unclassified Ruminococcus TaxID=2608920 RepID=UPI0008876F8A|nr:MULTISPECIES: hypothetical protein [unclassified Ruminococcus]SDA31493.1 hypothetical protein SAMN02910446_03475 [Ruminococcus sp. YE78]SFW51774.1 hypothetical protein SAMN02910447_03408 [Ruminococcus sp. YE71]
MIRNVKYAIYVVLTLCLIIFCGETAYSRLTDRASEKFESLYFMSVYNGRTLTEDISTLAKKYNCCGFFVIYESGECEKEIYCCTNGDQKEIKRKLGIDQCSFKTITGDDYCIEFAEMKDLESDKAEQSIISGLYLDPEKGEVGQFASELSQKYRLQRSGLCAADHYEIIAFAAAFIFMILLSVYDMVSRKKEVCIKITLGVSLNKQIAEAMFYDIAVFATVPLILIPILSSYTAAIIIKREMAVYLTVLCIADSAVYLLYHAVDICASLKNSNDNEIFLPINYTLKMISVSLILLLIGLSSVLSGSKARIRAAEKFSKYFSDHSLINISVSAYQAELVDRSLDGTNTIKTGEPNGIEQFFEDEKKYIDSLGEYGDVFMLRSLDNFYINDNSSIYRRSNVVVAAGSADKYIQAQTHTKPDNKEITVIVPEKYHGLDLKDCKNWLEQLNKTYDLDTAYKIKKYRGAAIAFMGESDSNTEKISDISFKIASSPIIIYIPDAKMYDYFDTDQIAVRVSPGKANELLKEKGIRSLALDINSINGLTDKYIKNINSVLLIFMLSFVSVLIYSILMTSATIMLDISLKRRDRAIMRISGYGFFSRHIGTVITISLSYLAPMLLASGILKGRNILKICAAVCIMFIAEFILFSAAAAIDSRKNTIRSLKGGAL